MPSAAEIISGFERPNLTRAVTEHLRHAILRPEIGDHLPGERRLQDQLKVSRIIIRAALMQLETEGLIQRRHGRQSRILRG